MIKKPIKKNNIEKLSENNNNKNENLNINNNPENKIQYINDSHYENTSRCPLCNSCIDYFKNFFKRNNENDDEGEWRW